MLVLNLQVDENIVLSDRATGKEIARLQRCDTHNAKANTIGFIADYNIAIVREKVNKELETVGAAILKQ